MKVLQFYRTYFPETQGGLEEAIRQICHGTRQLGASHRIMSLARVPAINRLERDEGEVIQVPLLTEPASCSIGLQAFSEYRRQAAWADLIHIHYPWPFADLVHLLSGVRKPVVVTYHSDIIRQNILEQIYAPLRTQFFKRVNEVVATSPQYAKSSPFLRNLSCNPKVIPLALDESSYRKPSFEALREVYSKYGEAYFLFVGVLRYYKGLNDLIDASAITGLRVIIAGSGPLEHELKARAKEKGASSVHFTGFVDDSIKQALFHNSKAVVFPSCERSEAFGVTLLEGQLHGKPLITCDIGTGTSFVNQHEKTGYIVPPNEPAALGRAMMRLAQNPLLAAEMGKQSRIRYDSLFSGQQQAESYMEIYQRLKH